MARRYLLDPLPERQEIVLPVDLARHLAVLRPNPGDVVGLFDGAGRAADAELLQVDRRGIRARVGPVRPVDNRLPVAVELAVALPKGARADWLFEHATEVGVAVLQPLRCVRSARGSRAARQRERFARIAAAATEQSDRSHLPEIREERTLDEWLGREDLPSERHVAVVGAERGLTAARAAAAALVIGPEGGLTADELEALAARGFAPCGLGPLTLRVETAALIGLSRLVAPAAGMPHEAAASES